MRIAAGLYLAAWAAIATAVIYVLVRAGQPLWLSQVPHPLGAVVLLLLLASLGAAFMYVGYRLLVMQNDEPLLRPRRVAR